MGGFGAERIDHVTIVVQDLEQARDFYGRMLELEEVPRPESFDFPGTWYRVGPTLLHLLAKPQPDTTGARHFAFWVRDIRAAARHIESVGMTVVWQQRHKIPGVDRFFLHDPDGNRVEIQGTDAASSGL